MPEVSALLSADEVARLARPDEYLGAAESLRRTLLEKP
jgi:hypothetical protein